MMDGMQHFLHYFFKIPCLFLHFHSHRLNLPQDFAALEGILGRP